MKVRINGFELIPGSGITLQNYCAKLLSSSGQQHRHNILAVSEADEDYYTGLFLSIRDARSFCKIQREGGAFKVTHEELEADESIVHFNFFILNKRTFRGLYQYYFGAATMNFFNSFLLDRYREMKAGIVDAEIAKLGQDPPKKKLAAIRKRYAKDLAYSIMERPDSFRERVESLKRVRGFSFDYMSLAVDDKEFQPLSGQAKRINHEVFFQRPADDNFSAIKGAIVNATRAAGIGKYQVRGIDAHDNEVVYKSANDFDVFEEYDYDDVTKTISIDSANLVKSIDESYVIAELLDIAGRKTIKQLLTVAAR